MAREDSGGSWGDWPWYAVFLMVVVFSLIATLLFVFPPALVRILGVSPTVGEVPSLDLWAGPYVALTAVLLSAIFLFMTLRIDRGAKAEARKEARKEAKHQIERQHKKLTALRETAKKVVRVAESAKAGALAAKDQAANARDQAQAAKEAAKSAEKDALAAKDQTSKARDGAQAAEKEAEIASGGAELAKSQAELSRKEAELVHEGARTALQTAEHAAGRLAELLAEAEAVVGQLPAEAGGLVPQLESAVQDAQEALAALRTQAQGIRTTAEDANRDIDERVRGEVAAGLPEIVTQQLASVPAQLREIVREEIGQTSRPRWLRPWRRDED